MKFVIQFLFVLLIFVINSNGLEVSQTAAEEPSEAAAVDPNVQILNRNIPSVEDQDDEVVIAAVEEDDESEIDPDEIKIDPYTGKRMYDGYKLIRAKPKTKDHLEILNFIANGIEDYWTPIPKGVENLHDVDMLVGPKHFKHVTGYLNCSNVPYNVTIKDIQRAINEENPEDASDSDDDELVGRPGFCTQRANFNWKRYQRMEQVYRYMDCIATEHRDKVQLIEIGRSSNNNRLTVVKIGRGSTGRAIWIDGGIHAREWISPASVMYMIYQLVENYDKYRDIVDSFDIYVMPVVNPDGYEFSHTNDRMWRKTRSNSNNYNAYSKCVGTDPNRNWGYKWGGKGASKNPCTETYRGSSPFSEPETRAIEQFILPKANNFKLFLTFHSYGQYILYPWGYTDRGVPPNWKNLKSLAQVGAAAMKRVGNHDYTIGSAAQVLYPAAGGSDDWARGSAKIDYSYTIELPDTGRYGFLLPKRYIDATVREAMAGVAAMIRELRNRL